MTKKWIAINVLLLLLTAALAWQLRVTVQRTRERALPSALRNAGT